MVMAMLLLVGFGRDVGELPATRGCDERIGTRILATVEYAANTCDWISGTDACANLHSAIGLRQISLWGLEIGVLLGVLGAGVPLGDELFDGHNDNPSGIDDQF
jgi:hypothetical protein